jgi:hypothetical protein
VPLSFDVRCRLFGISWAGMAFQTLAIGSDEIRFKCRTTSIENQPILFIQITKRWIHQILLPGAVCCC